MTIIGMSAFMQLRVIVIEGVPSSVSDEIIEVSGLSIGDNLFFTNSHNISQNIQNAIPFVNSAQVTRILPDTINIKIVKSDPVATITVSGEVYLIDATGRVLEYARVGTPLVSDVNISDLIEIRGVDVDTVGTTAGGPIRPVFGTETRHQHMLDILEILDSEDLLHHVSYIDVSNIVNVHFGFMNIYRVILGGGTNLRQTNLRHNISGLSEYVEQVIEIFPNTPGDIDMSNEVGPPTFRRPD